MTTQIDRPQGKSVIQGILAWSRPYWGKIAKGAVVALLAVLSFLGKEAWWAYTTIKSQQRKIAEQQKSLDSLMKWAACVDKQHSLKKDYVFIWPTLECQESPGGRGGAGVSTIP